THCGRCHVRPVRIPSARLVSYQACIATTHSCTTVQHSECCVHTDLERVGLGVRVVVPYVPAVARGVGLDHRLGPHFLRAGIGFGGSCFPKDVTALKQLAGNEGYPFLLLQAVWEVNELQKRRVVAKLQKHLGTLRGKTVALLGLSFKPNTDDMREAPSRVIAYRLLGEGAEVRAWDPVSRPDGPPGVWLSDSGP